MYISILNLNFSYIDDEDLKMLLTIIREEKMNTRKFMQNRETLPGEAVSIVDDPEQEFRNVKKEANNRDPYNRYDSYKVDFETFRVLFIELTQWGGCQTIDLAEKLFRVSLHYEKLIKCMST